MSASLLEKPVPVEAQRLYKMRADLADLEYDLVNCKKVVRITSDLEDVSDIYYRQCNDMVKDKLTEIIMEEVDLQSSALCEWVKARLELEKATRRMKYIDERLAGCL